MLTKNIYIFIISLLCFCSCSGNTIIDINPQLIYDKPRNLSEGNALKRAYQISNIVWTPFNDVPNNSGFFIAGEPCLGMPYSSVKELDKFIGLEVSFETFMTAIHNPRSVLYTENVRVVPYHGINCASYYGVVCSSVVNYALGLKTNYVTACLDTLSLFTKIPQQAPEAIQLCDVLWSKGHEVMVYDIAREPSDLSITQVSILEAASIYTRINRYYYKDFIKRWENDGWVIYRYNGFDSDIAYEPSPFVALEGEMTKPYEYNDLICPNRGNRAVYREGERVIIDILNPSYPNLMLYRENELVDKRLSHNTQEEYSNLQYGNYSVIATDSKGNQSDSICFEVVDANVDAKYNGSKVIEVIFQSEYGSPEYVKFCDISGTPIVIRELSDKDKSSGRVFINWPNKYDELYCKVMFSTPNGMVTNAPILVKNK
jgi:hypothetical protein